MTEEVEVKVLEVEEPAAGSSGSLVEGLRRLLLASIGAIALTRDETEGFVNKLVERGELAQKDGEKLLREFQSRVRQSRPEVQKTGAKVSERMEQGVEEFLNRLNIPSKRDIDELSAKIAQLSVRVEELRKNQQ